MDKKTHGHVLQFKFIVKMLMFVSVYFCQNIPKGKLINTKQGKRADALNGTDWSVTKENSRGNHFVIIVVNQNTMPCNQIHVPCQEMKSFAVHLGCKISLLDMQRS